MLDRRDFLKSAGLLTLGATMMPEVAMAKKPKKAKPGKKQIGFQAYSLGPELAGDNTAAGLKRLHDMGYTYVELAGFEGHSASELQKMASDAGIKVVSTHLNPNTNGEKYSSSNKQMIVDFWKKQIDEHAPFGIQYIVQPGLPRIDTIDDAKRVADVFNAAGEVAKKAGLKWGYHNHNREFNKVKGEGSPDRFIEEIFITETDPSLVAIELDVYWTVMGQQDPVEWINKYKDRIQLLHIKDRLVLGQSGMMNFEQIFKNFNANGHNTFFVEIEDTRSGKQMQRMEESANYLLAADFVK